MLWNLVRSDRLKKVLVYCLFPLRFLVCLGCCGDLKRGLELAEETPTLVRRSNNQLEKFLLRRAQKMLDDQLPNQQYCLLLAYELL